MIELTQTQRQQANIWQRYADELNQNAAKFFHQGQRAHAIWLFKRADYAQSVANSWKEGKLC